MSEPWLNGHPAPGVAAADRGLAYGDGLFETIRVSAGRAPLLERHLERLRRGCEQLLLPLDEPLLRTELEAFCAQLGDGVCKLIFTRGVGQRGYALPSPTLPVRLLQASPTPQYPASHAGSGIRLFPCATRLAEQPRLAGLKHLNRLEQVLARAEWADPAFAEGLMCDTSGRPVEGVFSNLFLIKGQVLITPALTRCGVAGVMRAELLDRARQAGLAVRVRDVEYHELIGADELFMCNSLYGIWPVVAFREHAWPVGNVTLTLQSLLADLVGSR